MSNKRAIRRVTVALGVVLLGIVATGCFGPGTHAVGSGQGQMPPGLYTAEAKGGCYWARLSSLDGSTDNIIDNDYFSDSRQFLFVGAGDRYVDLSGDCIWTPAPATRVSVPPSGDGTQRVGIEVSPGTYAADGGQGCYWARLSTLDGAGNNIIDNDYTNGGPQVVKIAPTDAAFESDGCGPWRWIGN